MPVWYFLAVRSYVSGSACGLLCRLRLLRCSLCGNGRLRLFHGIELRQVMFGLQFELSKTCLMVTLPTHRYGDVCFGAGWWVKGHWRQMDGWLRWDNVYYDGNWFGMRLGPFFFTYGPY